MKGRWKALLTLGGLAASALVYRAFEGDPESRRKRRAREEEKEEGKERRKERSGGKKKRQGS